MKNKKWFLFLTAFFAGMSIMAIELGASRLMSPYFSSSQIIWTIIIGTIMIAMAIGNVIGGKMADKLESPTILFIFLLSAAVWTCLIPFVGKFIIAGVAGGLALFVTQNFLVWAALLACILVFVYPLLVLGMITPNLVKYACTDLKDSGKTVGKIEALNTIGSIIGTFLPTFVTIPTVGTTLTFLIFASILFAICIVYFFYIKRLRTLTIILVCVSLAGCAFSSFLGTAFWDKSIIYEGESIYNYLRVGENDKEIYLSTNVLFGVQSVKVKDGSLTTHYYYDTALAAPVVAGALDEQKDFLILGLGTGTFATQSRKYFNNPSIDGVEIDKKIVDLAHKYFDLSDEVNTYIQDGRFFINNTKKKYDVIMVDAYQDITIPFQMSSIEFFTIVKEHLKEDGVMVVNMNMASNHEGSINDYLSSTIRRAFITDNKGSVYTCMSGSNIELFASYTKDIKEELGNKISTISNQELKNVMRRVHDQLMPYTNTSYLLTDSKAPVELLGMRVLDEMISEELSYIKKQIKGKSIKEIIEYVLN